MRPAPATPPLQFLSTTDLFCCFVFFLSLLSVWHDIDIFLFRCQFQNCHFPSNQFDVVVWPILRWIRFECFNDRQPTKSSIVFLKRCRNRSCLLIDATTSVQFLPVRSRFLIRLMVILFFKKCVLLHLTSLILSLSLESWTHLLFSSLTHTHVHPPFFPFRRSDCVVNYK